jgi:hypothetical protein
MKIGKRHTLVLASVALRLKVRTSERRVPDDLVNITLFQTRNGCLHER